ncbi:hypothetical protein [Streptomyces bauhiniae]|uniref:hypothetical protein n=1 Tax=Streptomyces bauhiniae TaxID=2340725 RepID=UPI003655B8B2
MTPRGKLALALAALIIFTGLAITLFLLGQPIASITYPIPVIAAGVQQILQVSNNRRQQRASVTELRSARQERTVDEALQEDGQDDGQDDQEDAA